MAKWKTARLGNYIQEYSERNKNGLEIPVYSVTNSKGFCTEYFSKEVASKDKRTYKIVKKGFFAYNPSRINVGSVDWLREKDMVIVSPLYNVFSVSNELCQQYLYYYLKSQVGLYYIKELSSGSVRDNLKFSVLSEFYIPFPPLDIQQQIADTLDKVTHTIDLCHAMLEKLDLLVKARFVEMFGDPRKNTQNRPTTKLINVVKMQRGFDLPVYNRNSAGNIPVYGANGVLSKHDTAKVFGGGVITGRSGTIGKVYYTLNDYFPLNTTLFSSDLHGNNIIYLAYLLELFDLTRFKEGTGVPTLNRNKFHKEFIIDVPIIQQQQFADFAGQAENAKSAVKQVLKQAETLKQSLMQEYFGNVL